MLTKNQKIVLYLTAIFFFILYCFQTFLNHYYFRSNALDYGFYNQAFWDFAHFRINKNTVFDPALNNFFQVHPSFTLIILIPLYWIFNWIFHTYTLLFIQNIFIIIGAIGTYLYLQTKTKNNWIAILGFIHYNLIWGHFSAISFEYIDATIAASVIPLFFYLYEKEKFKYAFACILFAIVARENFSIWFFFIALFLALIEYKNRKRLIFNLAFGTFSLIYLIFLYKWVIPHFADKNWTYGGFMYSKLGNNPGEAFMHIIKHPKEALLLLFQNHNGDPILNGIKLEFYLVFLLSGGILLFTRPLWLLIFVPIIAQKMYNDDYVRWGINIFYSIEVVSILTIASFMSIAWIKNIRTKYIVMCIVCFLTLATTIQVMHSRKSVWYHPEKEKLYSNKFLKPQCNLKEIYNVLDKIPSDASVCASEKIVPHLSQRKNITIFPYVRNTDYIIFLDTISFYPLSRDDYFKLKAKYIADADWQVFITKPEIMVLKRKNK